MLWHVGCWQLLRRHAVAPRGLLREYRESETSMWSNRYAGMPGAGFRKTAVRWSALALALLGALGCDTVFGTSSAQSEAESADCQTESYQIPPAWDCSAQILDQIDADDRALRQWANASSQASAAQVDATAGLTSGACEASIANTRALLRDFVESQLLTERRMLLSARCTSHTGSRTTGTCRTPPPAPSPTLAEDQAVTSNAVKPSSAAAVGNADEQTGASEFSTTNDQVAGVDEADIVKNDAEFVYTFSGTPTVVPGLTAEQRAALDSTELLIFSVWPAEQAQVVSRTRIEGKPLGLQLSGDRLLAYSSVAGQQSSVLGPSSSYGPNGNCSYGYDCVPQGDGRGTLLTIFDVSDRSAPREVQRVRLSSSYLSSRRIGDDVYTVLSEPLRLPDGVRTSLQERPSTPEAALAAYAELESANRDRIDDASPESFLPEMALESGPQLDAGQQGCGTIYQSAGVVANAYLTVLSLDLVNEAVPGRTTLLSQPGFTYASSDALYLAVPGVSPSSGEEGSAIHKFELDALDTRYVASGTVPGHVLNQFALDERDHVLRVATTTGRVPSPHVYSTLTLLAPGQQGLATLGSVTQIAPGEDIRAVRFAADRAYVVTFKKTDPLFVIDLSQTSQPKLAGELQIPGFSTYLQAIDDTHLLSIGYDADDQGNFAWFQGVQLQIFDVSDMSSPQLLQKQVIGTRGSSSQALTDHLAFTYFAPKHWLALPLTICEGGSGGTYGDNMTFSGLYLYDVSLDTGFQLLGGVAYPPAAGYQSYSGARCSNWWTDASSLVKRSIILDDYVLSLTDTEMKINAARDLSTDLVVLPLE
jgi:hypothetical protein